MTAAPPSGRVIALFGADPGGRAALAQALSQRLSQHGIAATFSVDASSDRAPDASALEAHRQGNALILLLTSASPTPVDDALRTALIRARLGFAAVHGEGDEQLANAWRAIGAETHPTAARSSGWACDKCSDPACEHRLFTDLLAQRR